ncbi:MAG TPA: heavy metal-responsive transcriptional regulator [Opitutaceae bacterium]|nr:heavy metal-responsive transcriptional regulator [Opitutaceae bacterium]
MVNGLKIGEFAREAGVNLQTVRYYERQGLLPKPLRTSAGYRVFSSDNLHRLHFIRRAKRAGFSLIEIRKLLSLRTTPGATRAEVRARAEAKVADIDAKIKNLKAMRSSLQKLIEGCQGDGPLKECSILESLDKEDA